MPTATRCPGCPSGMKGPGKYLCGTCWYALTPAARRLLSSSGSRAFARLRELHAARPGRAARRDPHHRLSTSTAAPLEPGRLAPRPFHTSRSHTMPITQHDQPVYKLICDNTDCNSEDWTALDPDDEIKYFNDPQHARAWGSANGWEVGDSVLCPADAAEARDAREQAEDIAAAVADALTEG